MTAPNELTIFFPILCHRPWHVPLLVDSFAASELVLQCPLEVCDHGNGGKLARRDICLPEHGSGVLFEDKAGFAASKSKDSKSLGGGRAKRSKIYLGSHNGKSRGLAGVSGFL